MTFNQKQAIEEFIERKGAADLFLFKNRSDQWVFQTYDEVPGEPLDSGRFFLMQGKPSGDGPLIMPKVGEVATVLGCRSVGLQWDENLTAGQLESELEKAFELLQENEANPQA